MTQPQTKTPRRLYTQPYDFSVQDLINKIKEGDIKLDPEYQRGYVWDTASKRDNLKSKLIESLLLNIPIPVIYFAETETLKYEVVDGQQRLRTFSDFLDDKFALDGLEIRNDLNKKKYSGLEQKDKDEIRKRSIRAIVILNNSDEQVKYEVFERLNMGSVELTPQELRNNTLRGEFNELLKTLARNETFLKLFKFQRKADEGNMSREELVLRFFAYKEGGVKRSDDLKWFLTQYMKKQSDEDSSTIKATNDARKKLFEKTINTINCYLGDAAFSAFGKKSGAWNTKSTRLIYEIEMLAFAEPQAEITKIKPADFKAKMELFLKDSNFAAQHKSGGVEIRGAIEKIVKTLNGNDSEV